jgi:hypothetical protein
VEQNVASEQAGSLEEVSGDSQAIFSAVTSDTTNAKGPLMAYNSTFWAFPIVDLKLSGAFLGNTRST